MLRKISVLMAALLVLAACGQPYRDLGDEYHNETDYQYYFSHDSNFIAESETHFFFYGMGGRYLCSRTKETGEVAVLCNKPDCLHHEEKVYERKFYCNAYASGELSLQYYEGALYSADSIAGDIGELIPVIYKIETDGSGYTDILRPRSVLSNFIIHRGTLYMTYSDFHKGPASYTDEEKAEFSVMGYGVYAYSMKNLSRSPKKIIEETGHWGQIDTVMGFGNTLCIRAVTAEDYEETNEFSSQQWLYNINTAEKRTFEPPRGSTLAWVDDTLVYFGAAEFGDLTQKAVRINFDGTAAGELDIEFRQDLYAFGGILAADNRHLVTFDLVPLEERSVQFYNDRGELLNEVLLHNRRHPGLGITRDYYFYLKNGQNGDDIWAIDLSDLDNPNLEGKPFYEH
ncbi:MAG: hypothetical protein FWG93_00235 [Oscillospiraceae bacterium]|nr:hypothetical protein [Oscillospiraceae bacterium]